MTRGARKLEAAIERFRLGARIRGAHAVDVGASAGGFTRALLEHGAKHVLAVDLGHGQLEEALRHDPRVRLLEKVDWKRLPPSVEPGPFDVFTVDVSFVAARSMLRGLAFRLAPKAHGIVLVKPQFELPEGSHAPGRAADATLRARALARFEAKASKVGFAVIDSFDSPVAGGSGAIEILAHVRFDGWAAKPAASSGAARPVVRMTRAEARDDEDDGESPPAKRDGILRWFAITAPGLEAITESEVRALQGVSDVQTIEGGVGFAGSVETGMRANLWLRTATRVLGRAGHFRAEDFASFRRRAAQLEWAAFLRPGTPIEVQVTAHRCRLFHTDAVRENVEHAIKDWSRKARATGGSEEAISPSSPGEPLRLLVRGSQNRWTMSVDSSGALLHLRGARVETGRAPMRETLAAALLGLCAWDGSSPFVDPMCGSGTLLIEAASKALGRAPGLDRGFAFERWPSFDPSAWSALLAEARRAEKSELPAPIVGHDRDPAAVRIARRNVERAGLGKHVVIHHGALASVRPPPGPGLVLFNPPYGRRLEDPRAARATMREVGTLLRDRFRGWRVGVLVPDARWARDLGIEGTATTPLKNGGLRVHLVRLTLPS